jgi:hypothetical protein
MMTSREFSPLVFLRDTAKKSSIAELDLLHARNALTTLCREDPPTAYRISIEGRQRVAQPDSAREPAGFAALLDLDRHHHPFYLDSLDTRYLIEGLLGRVIESS